MARGFRLLPVSLRRRSALVTALVLLVTVSVALTIVWQAAGSRGSRRASLIQVSDKTVNQMTLAGTGCNLTGLPTTNLVSNGSFTPEMIKAHFFAGDGGSDRFDIKMSETQHQLPLAEDFYKGAIFQHFHQTQSEMSLVNTGRVTGYELGIVSGKRELELPAFAGDVRWHAFAEAADGRTYLCGSAGALVRLDRDGGAERIPFRFPADLTALAAGPGGLIAGDARGQFYASADGLVWNLMSTGASGRIRALSYIDLPDYENGFFLASGGPGELFFGHPSGLEKLQFPLKDTVTALIRTGDGILFALGDQGQAAYSSNGIKWQRDESLEAEQGWMTGDAAGGIAFFAGGGGQMALRPDKGSVKRLDSAGLTEALSHLQPGNSDDNWPVLAHVMVLSSNKLVVITSENQLVFSRDGGRSWSRENPFNESRIDRLKALPSGDIFLSRRDGKVIQAELTARIRFEPALQGDKVRSGDLMALSMARPVELDSRELEAPYREEVPGSGEWLISAGASLVNGPDAAEGQIGQDSGGACELSYEDRPGGQANRDSLFSVRKGTAVPLSVNNPNRPYLSARLAQKLDLTRLVENDSLPFYRLEFDARIEGGIDGSLDIWFTGSLPDVGTAIAIQGDSWQHRRATLVFPRGLRTDDELWLNIGFSGRGTLFLDNIWFGRNDDAPGALSSRLQEGDHLTGSDVIRLEAVPIGREGNQAEAWCLPEGLGCPTARDSCFHNLGAALQLVESSGAVPWLVIDLNTTPEELAHLIEYLAGSPLSSYGKLRSRDGAIGRWTDVFSILYMEITDREAVLPNDATRANYVHWIMDQIKGAPDFQTVGNKLFFVDAMPYDDGRSHTSADYHAGDYHPSLPMTSRQVLEDSVQDWINRIPRGRMVGSLLAPELIRSIAFDRLEEPARLVDAVAGLLADLGNNSAMALLDIDFSQKNHLAGDPIAARALAAAGDLSGLRLFEEPTLVREGSYYSPDQGGDLADSDSQTVVFYVFGSRGRTILFALNLGQSARLVSIQGIDRQQEAAYELYDHRGNVISQGIWKRSRDVFTLLPGGLLIIRQLGQPAR